MSGSYRPNVVSTVTPFSLSILCSVTRGSSLKKRLVSLFPRESTFDVNCLLNLANPWRCISLLNRCRWLLQSHSSFQWSLSDQTLILIRELFCVRVTPSHFNQRNVIWPRSYVVKSTLNSKMNRFKEAICTCRNDPLKALPRVQRCICCNRNCAWKFD